MAVRVMRSTIAAPPPNKDSELALFGFGAVSRHPDHNCVVTAQHKVDHHNPHDGRQEIHGFGV